MNTIKPPDNLDKILLQNDTLLPSSGFTESVMETIQQQAAAPAPIPFPWKLALPGFAVFLVGLTVVCWLLFSTIRDMNQSASAGTDVLAWLYSSAGAAVILRTQAAPAVLAIAASWGCVLLCRKLAGEWSSR